MVSKKEFLYYLEVKEEDGRIGRYSVHKKGKSYFITNTRGNEHLVHIGYSIEDEIRIAFNAKVLKTIMPGMD